MGSCVFFSSHTEMSTRELKNHEIAGIVISICAGLLLILGVVYREPLKQLVEDNEQSKQIRDMKSIKGKQKQTRSMNKGRHPKKEEFSIDKNYGLSSLFH